MMNETESPEEDKSSMYKEMYDMGEKLMEMAKQCGYSPEKDPEEASPDVEGEEAVGNASKVSSALGFLGGK